MPHCRWRPAVRLKFVLSGPAPVTFAVFGPAPSCSAAARFTVAGHRGLNSVRFTGRIQGRELPAGVYTIVPQPTAIASHFGNPNVAIAIDARGTHPTKQAPPRRCQSSTSALAHIPPHLLLPGWPRHGEVKAATATEPATAADTLGTRATQLIDPRESRSSVTANIVKLWTDGRPWSDIAVVLTLLGSLTLLLLSRVRPGGAAMRFTLARVFDERRDRVAALGCGFIVAAIILFLLTRLLRGLAG